MKEKALVINGNFTDLGDLLQIARVEGKKVLGCDRVTVNPKVFCLSENSFVVVVSNGCSTSRSSEGKNAQN
jgi:hypothetical protein